MILLQTNFPKSQLTLLSSIAKSAWLTTSAPASLHRPLLIPTRLVEILITQRKRVDFLLAAHRHGTRPIWSILISDHGNIDNVSGGGLETVAPGEIGVAAAPTGADPPVAFPSVEHFLVDACVACVLEAGPEVVDASFLEGWDCHLH